MDLRDFQKANARRNGQKYPDWRRRMSDLYWCTALANEVGELCDLAKKEHRQGPTDDPRRYTKEAKAEELADVLTYLCLYADFLGVDLASAAIEKFNVVSERLRSPGDSVMYSLDEDGRLMQTALPE